MRSTRLRLLTFAAIAALSIGAAHAQEPPSIDIQVTPETGVEHVTPTITWEAKGVQSCTATGGWSGNKPLSGTEQLPQIDRSMVYGLVCVTRDGRIVLSWQAPTQNTNGTPLTDLAGFKVYTSQTQMALGATQPDVIANPAARSHTIDDAPLGLIWLAVTAYNASNIESDMSNAVSKDVQQASTTAEQAVEVKTKPNPPTATAIVNGPN